MKRIFNPARETWPELLQRPTFKPEALEDTVRTIFSAVSRNGDLAVREYTRQFDNVVLDNFAAGIEEIAESASRVPDSLRQAIAVAMENIESFHKAQQTKTVSVETSKGVRCWQEKKPIQKVGIYIPGGSAPLFSTVLMLAIPAKLAGCREIVLCSPPDKDGKIPPAIAYAAKACGISKVYKAGGIQAIAAMTFGTETIPAVYKIFGPGNQYVTVAKQYATRFGIAIDMPAGPSELLVLADESANPAFVAADLLSQAEHGPDSQVILVTTSESLLEETGKEIGKQMALLPRRDIASRAIANSRLIAVGGREEALDMVNSYSPEHLIITAEEEDFYLKGVVNAGSVFLGNYTPESAGDYASGTNHTLPTNGYARQYSGVNLDSFLKSITYQRISREGLQEIGPAIETMAEAEGLQAHKNAVSIRLATKMPG